ncbi:MAG: alcohol dehydrogenase catalytic domain-containing protein, partial [Pseudomonadota bacterium]
MKALVYTAPEQLELRDAVDPTPAEGDVLINVEHCGICGSDMHAYLGHDERRPAPLILGHEAAGTGADGKRYTVNPLVTSGTSSWCKEGRDNLDPGRQIISMEPRQGAFAERLAMPAGNLVEIPDGVPTEKAALAEPLACGWHAVRLAREAA